MYRPFSEFLGVNGHIFCPFVDFPVFGTSSFFSFFSNTHRTQRYTQKNLYNIEIDDNSTFTFKNMEYFTPLNGLVGGSLIGFSSAILLLLNGDIMGASGIVSSVLLSPRKALQDSSQGWKLVFLASFLVTAHVYATYVETNIATDHRQIVDESLPVVSPLAHTIAGFMVGFGTKLGNGCTTGHGICGMARMSKRSFAAVGTFMATAMFTASLLSPNSPVSEYTAFLRIDKDNMTATTGSTDNTIGYIITMTAVMAAMMRVKPSVDDSVHNSAGKFDEEINQSRKVNPAGFAGAIFALGLALSRMVLFSKVYGFLDLTAITQGTYDPTLMAVMGGGLVVSWIAYQYVEGHTTIKGNPHALTCPLALKKSRGSFVSIPTNKIIDMQLLVGASVFGVGWAMAGLCPGPAMFAVAVGNTSVIHNWWPSFIGGAYLAQQVKERMSAKL